MALKGRLVLPVPEGEVEFATLMLGPREDAPAVTVLVLDTAEIVVDAVIVRLEAGASEDRIASVVQALTAGV